jgi:hypothetical protein
MVTNNSVPEQQYNYVEKPIRLSNNHDFFNLKDESTHSEKIQLPSIYRLEERNNDNIGWAVYYRGTPRKYKTYIGIKSKPQEGFPTYKEIAKTKKRKRQQ